MSFEFNYKQDGDVLYGSDLMENLGFMLTAAINYAIDGSTVTNQDNLDSDLFNSDTASTKTNLTYSAGDDRYDCDNGQDYCTLITDVHTISGSETVAIVKGQIVKESTTVVTTSVSFNNGSNWTVVTEKELAQIPNAGTQLKIKWYFDRTGGNTGTDYISGYGCYYG